MIDNITSQNHWNNHPGSSFQQAQTISGVVIQHQHYRCQLQLPETEAAESIQIWWLPNSWRIFKASSLIEPSSIISVNRDDKNKHKLAQGNAENSEDISRPWEHVLHPASKQLEELVPDQPEERPEQVFKPLQLQPEQRRHLKSRRSDLSHDCSRQPRSFLQWPREQESKLQARPRGHRVSRSEQRSFLRKLVQ